MDTETAKSLSRIEQKQVDFGSDISEIKIDIKGLRNCFPSRESFNGLVERVEKLEGKNDRTTWYIILTVLGMVLNSVLNK